MWTTSWRPLKESFERPAKPRVSLRAWGISYVCKNSSALEGGGGGRTPGHLRAFSVGGVSVAIRFLHSPLGAPAVLPRTAAGGIPQAGDLLPVTHGPGAMVVARRHVRPGSARPRQPGRLVRVCRCRVQLAGGGLPPLGVLSRSAARVSGMRVSALGGAPAQGAQSGAQPRQLPRFVDLWRRGSG